MAIIRIEVTPDCQIPAHVYNEAVELFQNHLKEYAEEQLLIDGSSLVLCGNPGKIEMTRVRPISPLGQYCPAIYKNSRGVRNVLLTPEFQKRNTRLRNGLRKADS